MHFVADFSKLGKNYNLQIFLAEFFPKARVGKTYKQNTYKMLLRLLMPLLFISAGCGRLETDKVCREQNRDRPCTENEVRVIYGIQKIIDRIVSFNPATFESDFLFDEVKGKNKSQLYLLGENHSDIDGQLATWSYVNHLGKNGGLVLKEGLSRKTARENDGVSFCAFLANLYAGIEWAKLNRPYYPSEYDSWIAKNMPLKECLFSLRNFNFSGLNLVKMTFGYWDVDREKKSKLSDVDAVLKRNRSLVKAVLTALPTIEDKPLFVVAGYEHLPLGDLSRAQAKNRRHNLDIPNSYEDFYDAVEKNRALPKEMRKIKLLEFSGTTANIFRAFKQKGIGYFQAIPMRSLVD